MRTDCGVEDSGCVVNERIITQESVVVSEVAALLTNRSRLRRKREASEDEGDENKTASPRRPVHRCPDE